MSHGIQDDDPVHGCGTGILFERGIRVLQSSERGIRVLQSSEQRMRVLQYSDELHIKYECEVSFFQTVAYQMHMIYVFHLGQDSFTRRR